MPYLVKLKKSAEKELDHLPPRIHEKVIHILLSLQENPFPSNSKKLRGRDGYRIRVGDYRVLYLIDQSDRSIEVISVAHRREVYRF
jgi:mRNA interferase RelE/StbE